MNRGENVRTQDARTEHAEKTMCPHADLAVISRQIFMTHRTTDPIRRASLCQRAARLHYELSRGQRPSERQHRQERALALMREALSLTNPAHRYHRAKLMLQCARLYRNLNRNPNDQFEACDLMVNAASLFLKILHNTEARQIANEARELADEYGICLVLPDLPPPRSSGTS